MAHIAELWNRILVILPYQSIHTKDIGNIDLCSIFNFSSSQIICEDVKDPLHARSDNDSDSNMNMNINMNMTIAEKHRKFLKNCKTFLRRDRKYGSIKHLCFKGLVWGPSNILGLEDKIDIMEYEPRLVFNQKYKDLFLRIKQSALKHYNIENAAVVHWRRGDQLNSRCSKNWQGLRDFSVNCMDTASFMQDVRTHLKEPPYPGMLSWQQKENLKQPQSAVLVATNEKNQTILDELRAQNFIPLVDIINNYKPTNEDEDVLFNSTFSSIDEFIVETQFMIQAPEFISYGISQVLHPIPHPHPHSSPSPSPNPSPSPSPSLRPNPNPGSF